jgi:uncharacterized protein (TIGR03084 family)
VPNRHPDALAAEHRHHSGQTDYNSAMADPIIFDDLQAELDRLEDILDDLTPDDWDRPSAAAGWTISDVVLHLAQTEEGVVRSIARAAGRETGTGGLERRGAESVDDAMERAVSAERAPGPEVFERWKTAHRAALDALRHADPRQPVPWAAAPLKPATLATTRIAEHWAHALDITEPLQIPFPDTDRLRHIAWLGHTTLPYAFGLAGQEPHVVFVELTAPDGESTWSFGPPAEDSTITGTAGAFCRVGAHRLAPADSGLLTTGPWGAAALAVLRNYAG